MAADRRCRQDGAVAACPRDHGTLAQRVDAGANLCNDLRARPVACARGTAEQPPNLWAAEPDHGEQAPRLARRL